MTVSLSPLVTLESKELLEASAERVDLIEQLLAIGTALSSSNDLGELLYLILSKSIEITCSDAGSVYLIDRSDAVPKLLFKVAQNNSVPSHSFQEFAMPLTQKSLAGYVGLTGESLNLSDAYNLPAGVPYQLDRSFDTTILYRTCSVLVLPMQEQDGEVIGVLQLINRKVKSDIVITTENAMQVTQPYSEWEERIVRSLTSQAAISIERNHLQHSIENLFEGFVRASVQIIEARDPTTSGHSERVADLTVRLTEEANAITTGPLRSIYFNARQIQEVRYAALLHDFGKVGIPEALLGKRKKLYPEQLEVIRYRFGLAERTLEMECAQNKFRYLLEHPSHKHLDDGSTSECSHCQSLTKFDKQLAQTIETLNYYWELLQELNEPDVILTREFHAFSEETSAQLSALAEYTYRMVSPNR